MTHEHDGRDPALEEMLSPLRTDADPSHQAIEAWRTAIHQRRQELQAARRPSSEWIRRGLCAAAGIAFGFFWARAASTHGPQQSDTRDPIAVVAGTGSAEADADIGATIIYETVKSR